MSRKPFGPFPVKSLRLLFAIIVLGSAASSFHASGQTPGQMIVFPTSIQWNKQHGITWYRVQISGDATFRNVYYDRRIFGGRYTVSNLPPGYYYWRIAAADDGLGAFSRPVRFFVSGGVVTPVFIFRDYLDQETAFARPGQRR